MRYQIFFQTPDNFCSLLSWGPREKIQIQNSTNDVMMKSILKTTKGIPFFKKSFVEIFPLLDISEGEWTRLCRVLYFRKSIFLEFKGVIFLLDSFGFQQPRSSSSWKRRRCFLNWNPLGESKSRFLNHERRDVF